MAKLLQTCGAIALWHTFVPSFAFSLQTVWVDFDSYTTPGVAGEEDDYEYGLAERETVLSILHDIFQTSPDALAGGPFGIDFLETAPPPFTSTLVKVNAGLGHAEKIDFRNLDDDDDVSIHAVRTLKLFVDTPRSAAFGGGVWTEEDLLTSANIAMATANLAAHELGHSFGLRHHDAFTPIGSGIGVAGDKYSPTYVGPHSTNTGFHIMGLNSSVALTAENLITPSWLSPRSALKLMINRIEDEIGPNPLVFSEAADFGGDATDGAGMPPAMVPLAPVAIPNTTRFPDPFGRVPGDPYDPRNGPETFSAFAAVVEGSFLDKSSMETVDLDYYAFAGPAGAHITIEVISKVLSEGEGRLTNPVDPRVELLDSTLAPVPYPATTIVGHAAWNDDQFESTDSILFDAILPASGVYIVEVRPDLKEVGSDPVGDYELLIYGINEKPASGFAADFDDDGDVDSDDLTVWQDSYAVDAMADADEDGDSDGFDFLIWQKQFGAPLPTAEAILPVPEPAAAGLQLLLLAGVSGCRPSRRR